MRPSPKRTGLQTPYSLRNDDYTRRAGKDVHDELVYQVVRAMYENPDELRVSGALWEEFTTEGMSKDVGIEYHPGAIKFYQEKGIWPTQR